MKQFNELDIIGPDEQLLSLVEAVSRDLPAGWHRDSEVEDRMDWHGRQGTEAGFAFARDAREAEPTARLFLHRERGRLHVSNIVPRDSGHLSMHQYNAILDEFAETLRAQLPLNSEFTMNVTSDEAAITDWLSGDAADLLTRFSNLASMSTGDVASVGLQTVGALPGSGSPGTIQPPQQFPLALAGRGTRVA